MFSSLSCFPSCFLLQQSLNSSCPCHTGQQSLSSTAAAVIHADCLGPYPPCAPTPTPQDVIDGYLRPLRASDWDRASLLNFRAFSLPPPYDYVALRQPVLLVQASAFTSKLDNPFTLLS